MYAMLYKGGRVSPHFVALAIALAIGVLTTGCPSTPSDDDDSSTSGQAFTAKSLTPTSAGVEDVTHLVDVAFAKQRSSLDRVTRLVTTTCDVHLHNPGPSPVEGPLYLVFDVRTTGATMPEAAGETQEGYPYYVVREFLGTSDLPPAGSVQVPITVTCSAANRLVVEAAVWRGPDVERAYQRFTDAAFPVEEAARSLFQACLNASSLLGYERVIAELDRLQEEYLQNGGSLQELAARSAQIPPQSLGDDTAKSAADVPRPCFTKDSKPTNVLLYINGIDTSLDGYIGDYLALRQALKSITEPDYEWDDLYNPTSGFLGDIAECTQQELLEWIELFAGVGPADPVTVQLKQKLRTLVASYDNVIVVPHSQGNFYTFAAIRELSHWERGRLNVIETGSPAQFVPDGLRSNRRVDIWGDFVARLSIRRFSDLWFYWGSESPEDGEPWIWSEHLPLEIQLGAELLFLRTLDEHSFRGSYLWGGAKAAVVQCFHDALLRDEHTVTLPGGVPLEMVWIPGGSFMMGRYPGEEDGSSDEDPQLEQDSSSDEEPQHKVTVPGFWMAKYELTKRQWKAVMGTEPWWALGGPVSSDPDSAAVRVSWNDAREFVTRLSNHTGNTFRLPSEAEWEYACRGGTTTRFYWGDDPSYSVGNDYCWWRYNAYSEGHGYAHVVGQKLPNAFGLYDMNGNAWEWCQDRYHSSYTGAPTDGSAWESSGGGYRIQRGGGCCSYGGSCRSAGTRGHREPSETDYDLGFRVAMPALQ